MKRMLFVRGYKQRRGGHITVRDFFAHSMKHPEIDPYIYFKPGSDLTNDVWASVPEERYVTDLRPLDYDLLFIGGRTWRLLPDDLGDTLVINVILHIRHAKLPSYKRFLGRPAFRIADAQEVADAIAPLANGPVEVIHESIDLDMFPRAVEKVPGSVLIYGQKNPSLADRLAAALRQDGVTVASFNEGVPQTEFARLMASAEIFVGLPNRTEGFYRPPVEAMACGTAVVSSDAVGSRVHLIKDVTCLQPPYGDFDGYLAAIQRLLVDEPLRHHLQARGYDMAQQFSVDRQRERYFDFLGRHALTDGPVRT